ncbi:DUF2399 domain-containing protein [Micromonospora aurantiaca (nom. illeg.)]|uniref:DUF2399 domain-containing protein n=1 Tax=Micromonospora aurantiaca (nom. illeg.) TaxID=47850 RepID=UPI000827689E|nr:DUF2399 domain-containing protein [Micromonospora aurantiaca]SCL36207.1 TIGR02679 family protein [Micromonospora aurantiaca]
MSDLHDPEVRPLWQAVKDRLVITGDLTAIKSVRVALSTAGLARINGWLAHAPGTTRRTRRPRLVSRDGWVSVPVDRIREALGPAIDLADILRDTVGMPDVLQPNRRLAAMKTDVWAYAQSVLPDAPQLLQHLRSGGLSETSVEDRRRLINALARAHSLIPLQRPVPLPRLSLYCAGDPHYFDLNPPGQGSKLVMLVAELTGQPTAATTPNNRFALLARAGIYPDRVSATVIVLNLAATGDGPVDEAIRAAAASRRPLHISLYDLTVHRPRISLAQPILVVENPSVIEEALIRGYHGPLVCTSGALSAVDHEFLQQLADDGVPIHYSGDQDAAGVYIAKLVRTRFGAHIITPARGQPDGEKSDAPVYQESAPYLELLLGPDPSDPLHSVSEGGCLSAEARA